MYKKLKRLYIRVLKKRNLKKINRKITKNVILIDSISVLIIYYNLSIIINLTRKLISDRYKLNTLSIQFIITVLTIS